MIRAFRSARSRGNGGDEYSARNARCTVTTDLLCDIPTHKTNSRSGAAIFSLHTLASPSGRNVNYDEKQLTGGKKFVDLFLLSLQVLQTRVLLFSYNFCNTGVHYETPCINSTKGTQILCWNYILLNPLSMGEIHFKCATVTPHDYHQFCTRCTTSTPPGRIWLIIEDSYTTANHRRFSTNRTIFTEQVLSPHGRNHHVRR